MIQTFFSYGLHPRSRRPPQAHLIRQHRHNTRRNVRRNDQQPEPVREQDQSFDRRCFLPRFSIIFSCSFGLIPWVYLRLCRGRSELEGMIMRRATGTVLLLHSLRRYRLLRRAILVGNSVSYLLIYDYFFLLQQD